MWQGQHGMCNLKEVLSEEEDKSMLVTLPGAPTTESKAHIFLIDG